MVIKKIEKRLTERKKKKRYKMASSSSKHYVTQEGKEEYPYPSHVCSPNFVTFKLSGRDEYSIWKTQMLYHIESHGMLGFINGKSVCPQTSTSSSGKEKVGSHDTYSEWRRSDDLIKGWIFGSLSNQTLGYVLDRVTKNPIQETTAAFTAKRLWDELQIIYGPAIPQQDKQQEEAIIDPDHENLYKATITGTWEKVICIMGEGKPKVVDKITNNGNTTLHVAVETVQTPEFLEKMLGLIPENTQLLHLITSNESTLLHVAAIVGNTKATEILVTRYPNLLLSNDAQGHTALAIALSNTHTDTAKIMLDYIKTAMEIKERLFSGTSGDELLAAVISSQDFRLAMILLEHYKKLSSDIVLRALAQNFPRALDILEKYSELYNELVNAMGRRVTKDLKSALNSYNPLCCSLEKKMLSFFFRGILVIIMFFPQMLKLFVWPFVKDRVRIHRDAVTLLKKVCKLIRKSSDQTTLRQYYNNSILDATRQNAYEVVHHIVKIFPTAIWSENEDGHNFIQYAVICRSEEVYNLLYQMSEHKNIYRTIKDSYGNNLLHLAARLAPINRLNLISGAALQIQREIQWFKEVEGFVCPLNILQKNSFNETPQMIFTREHKELVIEGEKWMKATAKSYTITAALIITIVFAAAITVPGGNNQGTSKNDKHKNGLPVFTNNISFNVFAISNAISLFAAVTSLLIFLSILTTRFAEKDFLFKLPTKLIIGSTTLFISTTAMVLAFGATLYLIFGQSNSWILILIVVLTCIPITSFVTLQLPLVIDLVSATYGRSIFGKKRDHSLY